MNHQEALTTQVFTLIDCLYARGMEEVVISPGSRSTPLALAAEIHPGITTYIHPDERSAAFFGLGLGKKDRKPVGLICTSGTAAANYTPAVAEAGLSRSPLVLLTSDRPAELQNIGAPQAIDQADMYSNYVSYYTELPVAEGTQDYTGLVETKVMQAAQFFTGTNTGPVHFNIPIREPLMPDLSRTDLFHREKNETAERTIHNNVEKLTGDIMIILGETSRPLDDLEAVFSQENVTVIADPRQHARLGSEHIVTTHDLMFSTFSEEQLQQLENALDYIVRVGEPVTSKLTNRFLSNASVPQILVSEYDGLKTFPVPPGAAYTGDAGEILKDLIGAGEASPVKEMFTRLDREIKNHIEEKIGDYDDEGRFMHEVLRRSPDEIVFASSSMPIRDVERYDTRLKHKIYANRGANGIDGVVSTAIAMAASDSVTLVIGDIALYHDMNGLVMAKLNDIDINIVVFNNDGGGIFNFLPQYENKDHFERLFGTPLGLDFEHTAKLYDFNYSKIESTADLDELVIPQSGRNLIEIMTDRTDNLNSHQALKKEIGQLVKKFEI
ncbi:2-succinyl-5-enolpyruvyl-6-hydroxy-3-cyclohexene-1-carboxylic-acid synthase [Salinicoccus halitifaciens]|uniref:2-succinyl-5-enolpyruvyl-6-hydroxy-3-cyclohexene-1-carboxylate synthase n=1 Tax=Salinicoccus halitifaciens TaxID=1073415 RepID=A0ABV2E5I3_9STAP|nr:2-succinyl-5-enolpyruvyl-6-hydroxy-3-cyclohexene-1-carboxylic-acid synthase [Salinicoccus halitifaciens]MCD2137269.1 2-succinyl-5-enolpyruvyl-6-hydroxy-3-cyclohexene-1-carboxylic-acid synthase [Salinicoccus halitifaciens]